VQKGFLYHNTQHTSSESSIINVHLHKKYQTT